MDRAIQKHGEIDNRYTSSTDNASVVNGALFV